MSGSGISWAICKSAPSSRQITTPTPHHSVFLQTGCPSCRQTNSVKALKALLFSVILIILKLKTENRLHYAYAHVTTIITTTCVSSLLCRLQTWHCPHLLLRRRTHARTHGRTGRNHSAFGSIYSRHKIAVSRHESVIILLRTRKS